LLPALATATVVGLYDTRPGAWHILLAAPLTALVAGAVLGRPASQRAAVYVAVPQPFVIGVGLWLAWSARLASGGASGGIEILPWSVSGQSELPALAPAAALFLGWFTMVATGLCALLGAALRRRFAGR
jgi:hypothetical protein